MAVRNALSLVGSWAGKLRGRRLQGGPPRQEPPPSEKTRTSDGPVTESELSPLLRDGWILLYAQRKIF